MSDAAVATAMPRLASSAHSRELVWHAASLLILIAMLGALCLPATKLSGPLDLGPRDGGNLAFMAAFARSIHRAPLEAVSLLPAFWRYEDGTLLQQDVYPSQLSAIYWGYAVWARLFGTSEPAMRLAALSVSLTGVALLWWNGRRKGAAVGAAAVFLYVTSPLTLEYALMPESTLVEGVLLLPALWGLREYVSERRGLRTLLLTALPIMLCAGHIGAIYIASACFGIFAATRSLKRSAVAGVLLAVPWALLLVVHLVLLDSVGLLDVLLARGHGRSFLHAFSADENPLIMLFRHWTERMGPPLMLLGALGAVAAVRARHEQPENCGVVVTLLAMILLLQVLLLNWVAEHRYVLQIFLPALAWLSAPALVSLWRGRPVRQVAAMLFVLLSIGLYVDKVLDWEPARSKALALREAALRAKERTAPGQDVLLVAPGYRFATHMIAQYYTDRRIEMAEPVLATGVFGAVLQFEAEADAVLVRTLLGNGVERIDYGDDCSVWLTVPSGESSANEGT